MSVGKYSYESITVHNQSGGSLIVGKFCSIATGVSCFLGKGHRTDWLTTYPFGTIHKNEFPGFEDLPHGRNTDVVIGNDVWIGTNTTIMGGVTIGDGAIIAAESHVVKNVSPYEIVGGNPAKHIKYRLPKEIIDLMVILRWWDLEDHDINTIVRDVLCSPVDENTVDKITKLIEKYRT